MSRRRHGGRLRPSRSDDQTPRSPAALCEAARRHLQAGRPLDAQLCCEQALAADAGHADALHLMGLLSLHAGHGDLAVAWIARALRQDPKPEYLASLGRTLQRQGRYDEALQAFDKAVQLAPDDAELWRDLGNVLVELNRPHDALLTYQQALALDPHHWDASCRSGFLLHQLGRSEEALGSFDRCEALRPDNALVLRLRADVQHALKRFELSLADGRRAHALDPTNADICNNIGAALQMLGRDGEALPWFDRALALRPGYIVALVNKASSLSQLHRFDEAIATYRHVKTLEPDNAEADWDLALLALLRGDFAAGWAGREARWRARPVPYPALAQPMWRGDTPVAGKTMLVCADEGLGDAIQFARYLPMLAARGARVILVVDAAACALLSDLPGVVQCLPKPVSALPAFDLHCAMSSLPLAFGTRLDSIPAAGPYLPPPAPARVAAFEHRLGPHDRLRVGLVWSGNPDHSNDHNRSIPLRTLSRILDIDATFVSLQKHPRAADQDVLRARPAVVDLTADLADFSDTAALVSCLDLVITVDTSVAHLAGALGRPTWIMLPYTPDYRWLLGRDDSPWYRSVRLFRQDERRDYAGVLDRIRAELLDTIASFEAAQP